MDYYISSMSIIPIRKKPDEQSEMVSQMLFGELCTIKKSNKEWSQILTLDDNYTGWVDSKMLTQIKNKELLNSPITIIPEVLVYIQSVNHETKYPIVAGSKLYNYEEIKRQFIIDGQKFNLLTPFDLIDSNHKPGNIIPIALKYLHAPYLWGGKSPFGIDCSAFVQIVYKINQIWLPRDAQQQYDYLEETVQISNIQPGYLAFFSKDGRKINHVGIVTEDSKIIHASGKVRVDKLDEKGIYNQDIKSYTHKLISIKKTW